MTKKITEQPRQIDEYIAEFLSILTFELRTPLASILGYSSLLKDTESSISDAEKAKFIDKIEETARSMLEIVHETADINRMGIDSIELDLQEVNLLELIEEVVTSKSQYFKMNHLSIKVEQHLPTDLPLIWADSERLFQIIDKLLLTIISRSENETITIVIENDNKWVTIKLTTKDLDISTDFLSTLPKTPVIWRMPSEYWNLGISKYLIEKHGGHISIENTEDSFSTIAFSLPINANKGQGDV